MRIVRLRPWVSFASPHTQLGLASRVETSGPLVFFSIFLLSQLFSRGDRRTGPKALVNRAIASDTGEIGVKTVMSGTRGVKSRGDIAPWNGHRQLCAAAEIDAAQSPAKWTIDNAASGRILPLAPNPSTSVLAVPADARATG